MPALASTCNIQMNQDLGSTTLDLFLTDTAGDEVELWSCGAGGDLKSLGLNSEEW